MNPISTGVEKVSSYKEFFGLNMNPFDLSPDPFFLFSSERNKDTVAAISQAIHERKGFIVMTGEVGTGKTLMLRCLFELWEREQTPFAYFIGPRLSTTDFLSYITYELGIEVADPSKGNLLRALYGFLLAQFERGLTTVLVIDEAHQIPRNVLEEIRLLANFETAQQKLIQILLVGQPELDKKLDSVDLRSLKQRITVRCQLQPLREDEIGHYIERRLDLAGAELEARTTFPPDTVKSVYRYSGGIPRLVNSVCDQAMNIACQRQMRMVSADIVDQVAANFRLSPAPGAKRADRPSQPAGQVENSSTEKLWQSAPLSSAAASAAAAPKNGNGGGIFGNLNGGLDSAGQSLDTASNGSKTGPKNAQREDPLSVKNKPRRRIIFGLFTAIILALPTGYIMARRKESVVRTPTAIAGEMETSAAAQPAAPTGPGATSSTTPPGAALMNPAAAPVVSGVPSAPAAAKPWAAPHAKIVAGTLSKPVLHSSQLPSSAEPPPVMGVQGRELDLGKALPGGAEPTPVTGAAPTRNKNVSEPKLIFSTRPVYPAMARLSSAEGVVTVAAEVDGKGNVESAQAISGPIVLQQAAIEAVKQWKYSPALIDGRPAEAQVNVQVTFRLN